MKTITITPVGDVQVSVTQLVLSIKHLDPWEHEEILGEIAKANRLKGLPFAHACEVRGLLSRMIEQLDSEFQHMEHWV